LLGDGDALLPRGGIAFAINPGGVNQPMAVFNVEKEPRHFAISCTEKSPELNWFLL